MRTHSLTAAIPDGATILATLKEHATTKTQKEIAALLGVPVYRVAGVTRRAGFKKPNVQGKRREQIARQRAVIEAHASTCTLKEIGWMLGVTGEYVRLCVVKWGIKRPSLARKSKLHRMSRRELRKLARQPAKTIRQIAAEAGVPENTLADEWRRRGIIRFTKREHSRQLLQKGMRVCTHCRRVKPLEQFRPNVRRLGGRGYWCLECHRPYLRECNRRRRARLAASPSAP